MCRFKVADDVKSQGGNLPIKPGEDVKVQVRTQQARRIGRQGWIEIVPLGSSPWSSIRRGRRIAEALRRRAPSMTPERPPIVDLQLKREL